MKIPEHLKPMYDALLKGVIPKAGHFNATLWPLYQLTKLGVVIKRRSTPKGRTEFYRE